MTQSLVVLKHTQTGWIACRGGIAGRGDTREAAVHQLEALAELVRVLAAKWHPPTSALEAQDAR